MQLRCKCVKTNVFCKYIEKVFQCSAYPLLVDRQNLDDHIDTLPILLFECCASSGSPITSGPVGNYYFRLFHTKTAFLIHTRFVKAGEFSLLPLLYSAILFIWGASTPTSRFQMQPRISIRGCSMQ